MNAQLTWFAAPLASLAHAASMQAQGQTLVDPGLAARLEPIIAQANSALAQANIDREPFWASVVPASVGLSPSPPAHIAENLFDTLRRVDTDTTSEELLLRAGPLRELWDARGPGLWRSIGRFARQSLAAPLANVILVRPALGGGGVAFPVAKAVSFEAMLANPQRELPEIVRLAWLLAQVEMSRDAALALVPPVLAAAEDVELARCDTPTMALALRAWHVTSDGEQSSALAQKLAAWWRDFQNSTLNLTQASAMFE